VDDAQGQRICAPDVGGEFEQSVGDAEGREIGKSDGKVREKNPVLSLHLFGYSLQTSDRFFRLRTRKKILCATLYMYKNQ